MDVAAEKATELPRLGSASKKLSAQASHTKKAAQTVQVVFPSIEREREARTCADRGAPTSVNFVEKARAGNRAVAAEGIHHSRIRCHGEGAVASRSVSLFEMQKKKKRWTAFCYPQKNIAPMMMTCDRNGAGQYFNQKLLQTHTHAPSKQSRRSDRRCPRRFG